MQNQNLISVIIPTFNSIDFIGDCLDSILQSNANFEIIVVDAGSKDGTIDIISEKYSEVKIIHDPENRGLTFAQNLGIKNASGNWILIMNSDAKLDKNCMSLLLETGKSDEKIAAVAPKIILPRMENRIDSVGILLYEDLSCINRGHMQFDKGQFDKEEEVFGVSDAVALYRKKALEEIRGYDNEFKFYGEEADLCFRLRLAGWICMYQPKAIAYHLYSGSMGELSLRKGFFSERNAHWNLIKNAPSPILFSAIKKLIQRYSVLRKSVKQSNTRASKYRYKHGSKTLMKLSIKVLISDVVNMPFLLQKRMIVQSKIKKVDITTVRKWFDDYKIQVDNYYNFE